MKALWETGDSRFVANLDMGNKKLQALGSFSNHKFCPKKMQESQRQVKLLDDMHGSTALAAFGVQTILGVLLETIMKE